MKRIVSWILAILILAVLPVCAFAELDPTAGMGSDTLVVDDAGLLTAEELTELEALAEEVSDQQGLRVVLVTTRSTGFRSKMEFAEDYYDHNFHSNGYPDGLLLLIVVNPSENDSDMDWYISTAGKAIAPFDDSAIDDLFETVRPDLRAHRYSAAFRNYFQNIGELQQRYQSRRTRGIVLSVILALLIGFLGSLIPMARLKSQVKNVAKKTAAEDYVERDSLNMYVNRDIYLYANTTSRVIETNRGSSGGGGGGTHVSSSGVTHGGHGGKV